jgi:hypothetical protein
VALVLTRASSKYEYAVLFSHWLGSSGGYLAPVASLLRSSDISVGMSTGFAAAAASLICAQCILVSVVFDLPAGEGASWYLQLG